MGCMRVGFDVSDIYLGNAGVHTYASQLLGHLARLADAPELTLVDAMGLATRQDLLEANHGILPEARLAQARQQVLLHRINGPWRRYRRAHELACTIDDRVLVRMWPVIDSVP